MSKPLVPPALAQFVTATASRNMTRPAYLAVAVGVVTMVLLTVDPAYEAAHHWVDITGSMRCCGRAWLSLCSNGWSGFAMLFWRSANGVT